MGASRSGEKAEKRRRNSVEVRKNRVGENGEEIMFGNKIIKILNSIIFNFIMSIFFCIFAI